MSERLDYLARRVGADRFFLASALAEYARGMELDDAALCDLLGCTAATLTSLRLCRRPGGEAAEFRDDVARLADRFGLDRTTLAQIVRWADAMAGLRAASARDDRGTLLAARNRTDDGAESPRDEERGRS